MSTNLSGSRWFIWKFSNDSLCNCHTISLLDAISNYYKNANYFTCQYTCQYCVQSTSNLGVVGDPFDRYCFDHICHWTHCQPFEVVFGFEFKDGFEFQDGSVLVKSHLPIDVIYIILTNVHCTCANSAYWFHLQYNNEDGCAGCYFRGYAYILSNKQLLMIQFPYIKECQKSFSKEWWGTYNLLLWFCSLNLNKIATVLQIDKR